MKHLYNYLGVIVAFLIFCTHNLAQLSIQESDYGIRPLFELDQLATGEAYPWISDDGLRIYYTAFNSVDSVFAIWYSHRESIEEDFSSHYLLSINDPSVDHLSAWLSHDEKTICYVRRTPGKMRDTEICVASRENLNEDFDNEYTVLLPDNIKGTVLSPSFTPDMNELVLFNEHKGHNYILSFRHKQGAEYTFESELGFPKNFLAKAGKFSKDGLEFFISLQQGPRKPSLWSLERSSLNDKFERVNKIESDIINDRSHRNHQVHFSSNKDFIVFTQSRINEWNSNGIYIVQRNNIAPPEPKTEFLDPENIEQVVLFPNPSIDHIYFENVENKNFRIEIFDSSGRILKVLSDVKDNHLVDISQLESGSYYFRIVDPVQKNYRVIKHIKL